MARRIVAKASGVPGVGLPRTNWARVTKPMRAIRSVRTLIKVDPKDGRSMPEFKNTLMRAGVGARMKGKTIDRQKPQTPPSFGTRPGKTIAPPSPTNRGGIRNPFRLGR